MEDDADDDSQSWALSRSLSWWMMKNLWQHGVPDERHLRVSVADTFLLEDGHLMYWYFTSSKSGRVFKVGGSACLQQRLVLSLFVTGRVLSLSAAVVTKLQ